MTLPTKEQLYEVVDTQFRSLEPGAPYRLDPDDPSHSQWVRQWLEIRDDLLQQWTDHYFHEFFPNAGRLDPTDAADGQLIEYWRDIYEQIGENASGRWSWNDPPPARSEPISLVFVERDDINGGFLLHFLDDITPSAAAEHLWPSGAPSQVHIESRSSEIIHLRLDLDALTSIRDNAARMISEAGVLTSDL